MVGHRSQHRSTAARVATTSAVVAGSTVAVSHGPPAGVRLEKSRTQERATLGQTHVVVVEWLYYSKRIIIVRWADLTEFFSLIFVCKMCVFVSRPMKIVTFHLKNVYSPKRVVDFPRERDTFRNKIMEIVEDFDGKSYNNNGKPWKS